MDKHFIDYRGDTIGALRDVRKRLRMARAGHIIKFICTEDQVIRLLREITFNDAAIINRDTSDEGVFVTIRKT